MNDHMTRCRPRGVDKDAGGGRGAAQARGGRGRHRRRRRKRLRQQGRREATVAGVGVRGLVRGHGEPGRPRAGADPRVVRPVRRHLPRPPHRPLLRRPRPHRLHRSVECTPLPYGLVVFRSDEEASKGIATRVKAHGDGAPPQWLATARELEEQE